jgi:hypothetical protein
LNQGDCSCYAPFKESQKRATAGLATERNRFVSEISDEVLIAYAHLGSKTEVLCREILATGILLMA